MGPPKGVFYMFKRYNVKWAIVLKEWKYMVVQLLNEILHCYLRGGTYVMAVSKSRNFVFLRLLFEIPTFSNRVSICKMSPSPLTLACNILHFYYLLLTRCRYWGMFDQPHPQGSLCLDSLTCLLMTRVDCVSYHSWDKPLPNNSLILTPCFSISSPNVNT